jgi:4-hydroxy-tetrahydrodipicolinate synthase
MALIRQRDSSHAFTTLLTPFSKDGVVDYRALKTSLDRQIDAGLDGVVVLDIVGEGYSLDQLERDRILATAVDHANGRMSVIAATGTNCTRTTVDQSRRAADLGADALLVTVPYYSKPGLAGVVDHFRQLALSVDRPIIADDDPARTAIDLGAGLLARLAEFDRVVGICHGSDRLAFFAGLSFELRNRYLHFTRGEVSLPTFVAAGGHGTLSPLANILPVHVRSLVDKSSDASKKAELSNEIASALRAIGREDIAALKEAASFILHYPTDVRLPLVATEPETVARIRHAFAPFARCEAGNVAA